MACCSASLLALTKSRTFWRPLAISLPSGELACKLHMFISTSGRGRSSMVSRRTRCRTAGPEAVSVKTTVSPTAVMPWPTAPVGAGPGTGAAGAAGAAAAVGLLVIEMVVPGAAVVDVVTGAAVVDVVAGADAAALSAAEVIGGVAALAPSAAGVPGGGVDNRSPTTSAAER